MQTYNEKKKLYCKSNYATQCPYISTITYTLKTFINSYILAYYFSSLHRPYHIHSLTNSTILISKFNIASELIIPLELYVSTYLS